MYGTVCGKDHRRMQIQQPLLQALIRHRRTALPHKPLIIRHILPDHIHRSNPVRLPRPHIFIKIFAAVAALVKLVKRHPYIFMSVHRIRQPVKCTHGKQPLRAVRCTKNFLHQPQLLCHARCPARASDVDRRNSRKLLLLFASARIHNPAPLQGYHVAIKAPVGMLELPRYLCLIGGYVYRKRCPLLSVCNGKRNLRHLS